MTDRPRLCPDCSDCDDDDDGDQFGPGDLLSVIGHLLHVVGMATVQRNEVEDDVCQTDLKTVQQSLCREAARLARLFDSDEKPTSN